MAVHLLARKSGLAEESVRKLFVIGDLRSGPDPEWRFHVATVVLEESGGWYAVDPIMPGPMPLPDWIGRMSGDYDRRGEARFYLTGASVIIPDLSVVAESREAESGDRVIELAFDPSAHAGFESIEGASDSTCGLSGRILAPVEAPSDHDYGQGSP